MMHVAASKVCPKALMGSSTLRRMPIGTDWQG